MVEVRDTVIGHDLFDHQIIQPVTLIMDTIGGDFVLDFGNGNTVTLEGGVDAELLGIDIVISGGGFA
jgi:hypothetical protein